MLLLQTSTTKKIINLWKSLMMYLNSISTCGSYWVGPLMIRWKFLEFVRVNNNKYNNNNNKVYSRLCTRVQRYGNICTMNVLTRMRSSVSQAWLSLWRVPTLYREIIKYVIRIKVYLHQPRPIPEYRELYWLQYIVLTSAPPQQEMSFKPIFKFQWFLGLDTCEWAIK